MPYKRVWEDPEVFLEHNGVKVYRGYEDDDADQPLTYWFTLSSQPGATLFDVRELRTWARARREHKSALRLAIESGELYRENFE